MTSDPQKLYDELRETLAKLDIAQTARKAELEKNKKYVDICEDATSLREQKKSIELNYDAEHRSETDKIQNLKDQVKAYEIALMGHALDAHRAGTQLKLKKKTRSGKLKDVTIGFKPHFQQMTLFS